MPFPTKSSIYNQKNWMTRMNKAMKKVAKKGPIKARRISLSNFLNTISNDSRATCLNYQGGEKDLLPDIPKADFGLLYLFYRQNL